MTDAREIIADETAGRASPRGARVWCAETRDGLWCAAAVNDRPDEAALNVKTLCGRNIVLPYDIGQRVPTCPDCRAEMGGGGDGQQ